jgi:hypothetical protein
MSNIQTLIDTVKEENLKGRKLQIDAWDIETDILNNISQILLNIQKGLFTFFDEERDRFLEQQADYDAARRAEAERLKESGARGFTTPAKTSSGEVAETPTQDGGLLGGLGIVGLAAALGTAVAGYFAGLTAALASGLTSVTKMISTQFAKILPSPKALTGPITDFFARVKSLAISFSKLLAGTGRIQDFNAFGEFSKTIRNFGEAVRKITTPVKNFFAPLGELAKLFPSGGGKFVEGIKTFGSKLAGIFKIFANIAKPIAAIIATGTAIFDSFKEFEEDTSLFEKILITLKNVVKELVSVFITSLLELGKDIVSWVAGALGFTAIEEYLDSFDIDQKFREIFDEAISGIIEFFNKTKDALYQAARAIGIVDVDPEAEARIAAREVSSAEESLAEADTRVQEAQAAVDAAPEGSRERARAETELNLATSQRNARAEDLQEAQQSAVERRTAAGLPPTPDTPATQTPQTTSQPEPAQPQYSYPVIDPVTNDVIGTFATAEEANQAALASGGVIGDPIAAQPTATADQLQEVTVPSRETRSETPPSARPTLVANVETVPGQPGEAAVTTVEPRVEPLSDLTNVTNINQAATAMQAAVSGIIPTSQDGIDGALSPASIMGAGLGAVVDGVKNLTSLPVGQASQEVAAAKDRPPVVAMGGSTTSIQNNVSSPNVHNYGSMSARSNDLSAQRLKDNMMA